jgi:glutamate-1-semialdehyde 2,1-aminomutase
MADDVAAVIMEPIHINGGCFSPEPGYLDTVRQLTTEAGALLIFDEVITGFRVALGGAQELLGVTPDLTVLGKALGSGFPISAVCGSRDIMSVVASGSVAHMGNFNGSPLAATAALAAVQYLKDNSSVIYPKLASSIGVISDAFSQAAQESGATVQFNRTIGAGFGFVACQPVPTHEDRLRLCDDEAYGRLAARLLDQGILAPARGLWYVSTEHSESDLCRAREAILLGVQELTSETGGVAQ